MENNEELKAEETAVEEVKIEETKELTEEERNEIRLNLQNFRESLCKKTAMV
jgi:hypothetical protein